MIYTIYNPTTGEIQGHLTSSNPATIELNTQNKTIVEGKVDGATNYIDIVTKQPVVRLKDPSTPYKHYNFDWTTKTWIIDLPATTAAVRNLRNQLLAEVDRVNPIWYTALTTQQQTELQQYRQALLDVPQQTGFPESVTWPSKPDWL